MINIFISKHTKAINLLVPILSFIAFGFISIYLGQDLNWDLLNYHYYNGYSFLNNRMLFDYAPAYSQTFLNPILDIPTYLLITYCKPILASFIVGGLHGLNFWILYIICQNIFKKFDNIKKSLASLGIAALGTLDVGFWSEIGTFFHDNITSLFVLSSLYFIIKYYSTEKRYQLLLSGVMIGLAAGTKLTGLIFAIALFISFIIIEIKKWTKLKRIYLLFIGFIAAFLATNAFWMIRLYEYTHNPFFPFLNKIFKSTYYNTTEPLTFVTYHFPQTLLEHIFYPFYFINNHSSVANVAQVDFSESRYAILYALLIIMGVIILYKKLRKREIKKINPIFLLLILFTISSYIIWQEAFSVYRYLIPIGLIVPIIIFLTVNYIFQSKLMKIIASILIILIIVSVKSPLDWGRAKWTDSFFDINNINIDKGVIILFGDEYSFGFLVPSFSKNVRFINATFLMKSKNKNIKDEMSNIIKANENDTYILIHEYDQHLPLDILLFLKLRPNGKKCSLIGTKSQNFCLAKVEINTQPEKSIEDFSYTKEHYIDPLILDKYYPIEFGKNGNAAKYQVYGWNNPEDQITWTEGESKLLMPIPNRNSQNDFTLYAKFFPLTIPGKLENQKVNIFVGNEKIGQWTVSKEGIYNVTIPKKLIAPVLEIIFEMPNAKNPLKMAISNDDRTLGIAVNSIWLSEITPYKYNDKIDFMAKDGLQNYTFSGLGDDDRQ